MQTFCFKTSKLKEDWNKSEVILDELANWERILLFDLNNKHKFYISSNGKELKYLDSLEKPADCVIDISPEHALQFFNQELNLFEAFGNNQIKFKGDSSDFLKLTIFFEYFEESTIEITGNCNILKFEKYDIYLGVGLNIEPFEGHPDPVNAIVIPLGLQIFPIEEYKNLSLVFEVAPEISEKFSIRPLWGIKYYFNKKQD